MGGISKTFKNQIDPFHLAHDTSQPRTFGNFIGNLHTGVDPFGGALGANIAQHNNTQNNLRGTMDPGQLLGANATQAAPFNPAAPGSIMSGARPQGPFINPLTNMRQGYTGTPTLATPYGQPGAAPAGGMPTPGTPTNGLQSSPDWASIIGRALRK